MARYLCEYADVYLRVRCNGRSRWQSVDFINIYGRSTVLLLSYNNFQVLRLELIVIQIVEIHY